MRLIIIVAGVWLSSAIHAQVWNPDLGNGRYRNPIIHADYSDPDVVRVGSDFYMTASSFNCVPALPVLHSTDLIHWSLVGSVFSQQQPADVFDKPQHGNGVWAPAIRYHQGWYYIYYGDPDFGIYMCRTQDPAGEWEGPHLVRAAKGWIDPCPLWDDDGKAYLVHAFAGSRAGVKSIVVVHEMSPDGKTLLDDGTLVFDGHDAHGTIEGTKFYKRNGYYYIFAPAGGVSTGWQTILRSRHVLGPYEDKIVLDQGNTEINGPHQGAWIELENGENWFIHFQEKQPYGRIVHLQPAQWKNDWLVIGEDRDGDGKGQPVMEYAFPKTSGEVGKNVPQMSDEFNAPALGLQWQWHANPEPEWAWPTTMGFLRMNPVMLDSTQNLWKAPNLLLQKMPAETFTTTTKVDLHNHFDSECAGLIVMGRDYAYVGIEQVHGKRYLVQRTCTKAEAGADEVTEFNKNISDGPVELRVQVAAGGICQFFYRIGDGAFLQVGEPFQAREGKWIGAKVGLFCRRFFHENDGGYADIDWFRIE